MATGKTDMMHLHIECTELLAYLLDKFIAQVHQLGKR